MTPHPESAPAAGAARVHELKTWPEFFQAVRRGEKTFEARWDDRAYMEGDTLCLREWTPETEEYTGEAEVRVVTYCLRGGREGKFGVAPGHVVMGLSTPAPLAKTQALREALIDARETLERIAQATPRNTNSRSPESMASWSIAVDQSCLDRTAFALAAPPRDAEAGGGVRARIKAALEDMERATPRLVRGAWQEGRVQGLRDALALASTPPPGPAVEDAAGEALTYTVPEGDDLARAVIEGLPQAPVGSREWVLLAQRLAEDTLNPHAPAPGAGVPADQSGDVTDMVPADGANGGLTAEDLDLLEADEGLLSLWGRNARTLQRLIAAHRSTPPAQHTLSAGGGA